MFLKFHKVTKSIYIIKVYWISLWIDYLAAGIFYKSIKSGVCDRSAKDAYSIMALDRASIFFLEVCVCFLPVYVSPLNTVRYHHMSLKKIWLELLNHQYLPITAHTSNHNILFSRWSAKRETSFNFTSILGNNRWPFNKMQWRQYVSFEH